MFLSNMMALMRRQIMVACVLFAIFVGVVVTSGARWSWSMVAATAAVGVALFLVAALARFGVRVLGDSFRREP